jgi:type II secretion system protein N
VTQQNQLPENKTHETIYESGAIFKIKVIVISVVLFLLTTFILFPIQDNLKSLVTTALLSNRNCPIPHKKLEFSFLLPKVIITSPTLSKRCLPGLKSPVSFDKAIFKVTMPTLWPPGIKGHLVLKKDNTTINLYPKFTVLDHEVRVTKTTINGSLISDLIGQSGLLTGDLKMEGHFVISKKQQLKSGEFKVDSTNVDIPAQTVSGFNIISLNLRKMQLAGSIEKGKLDIKAFKLGTKTSQLQAQFKGHIGLMQNNIRFSKLNLNGKVRLGEKLRESVLIIGMYLKGKKQVDGFYPMSLGGTLAAPSPQFLK